MDAIAIIISFCVVAVMAIGTAKARRSEEKDFNGGECPNCGVKWRRFDMDSQGGRGYACDNCGRITWVSYKSVDKEYAE